MKFTKAICSVLNPLLEKGLSIRIRHAFPKPLLMLRALRQPQSPCTDVRLDERVVVIGLGTAALTCLRELKKEGFEKVTIVSRDELYGGKCINYGCMPSEFARSLGAPPAETRGQLLQDFIAGMLQDVRKQFESLGYPIVFVRVESIQGSRVMLSDGGSIEFDRLIVAMGNSYLRPPQVPAGLSKLIALEDFWKLPAGCRVAIYAEGNVAALSLGDSAKSLGMEPTVLLSGVNAFAGLPSYRYFTRELCKRGIEVHASARLIRVDEQQIIFEVKGRSIALSYDYLVIASKPAPLLPLIDGQQPSLYDIDLTCASLPNRPDIVFLGDSAGFFTSAEAENQTRLLMRCWKYGDRVNLRPFNAMPICLHGNQSLAMVGREWTYTARQWHEIDFRSLGWSKIYRLEGKLWYIVDETSGKIEAIHICHKHAGELICLGGALMEFPVWDLKWMTTPIHPSSAEIFKVVAEQALTRIAPMRSSKLMPLADTIEASFKLPPTNDLHPGGALPEWLTREQCLKALLSRKPREYFAACFGLSRLSALCGSDIPYSLSWLDDNSLGLIERGDVHLHIDAAAQICTLGRDTYRIVVDYTA